jgi:broad specificity phosphatase PhoE
MTATTTRWWWVRHAPVTVNNGCVYGATDLPCDCSNEAVFKGLAARLPKDAVWVTSALQRTHQTAAAIVRAGLPGPAAIPGPDVVSDRDLNEQSFGDWHGKKYADLPALLGETYHRFWIAPVSMAPKGGESFLDLLERVHGAIRRLDAQFAGRDIIAVTHGGTIRAALALALELTPETALAFTIENCSLTRIVRHNDAGNGHPWGVVAVNQSPV